VSLVLLALAAGSALAGPAADDMARRSPEIQREILAIEVRSAGNRCGAVDRIYYNGEYRGMDVYSVRCSDSGSYMVEMSFRGQLNGRAASCIAYWRNAGMPCWRPLGE
jgi:hypothetical protein